MIVKRSLFIFTFWIASTAGALAENNPSTSTVVSVDLYVMSLCPFGVQAENVLFPAVKSLGKHAELKIHFIAGESTSTASGTPVSDRFVALHGKPEVEENIRQLCARRHYPRAYLDYILERNKNYRGPNWKEAAQITGLSVKKIDACAAKEEGAALLRENIKRHTERGVFNSPTIEIDGRLYQGVRGRKALTLALCAALKDKGSPLPAACGEADTLPPDPGPGASAADACAGGPSGEPFDIRVVLDKSCPECVSTLDAPLRNLNPNASIKTIDLSSAEGHDLVDRHRARSLPLYVLDKRVENHPNFTSLIDLIYTKSDDGYIVRTGSGTYMPTVQLDRPIVPRHLDLFVEALSPASYQAESALFDFMQTTDIKDLTFSIHFIVQEAAKIDDKTRVSSSSKKARAASVSELARVSAGPITAPRGVEEVNESLRQVCLFQKASMGTFFSYLACRSQNLRDPAQGQRCFEPDEQVTACMEGGEGDSLLRQDARLANSLEIDSGPLILWENRYGPFGFNEIDWKRMIERQKK